MRLTFTSAVLAASFVTQLAGGPISHAEDSLFSEIAMESVYETKTVSAADVAAKNDGSVLERVTGASSLVLSLEAAGFEPKRDGVVVTVRVDHAGWKLPVQMQVELEKDRIVCDMSLVELTDTTSVGSDALLGLLASGDASGGTFFAYDTDKKLIQLKTSLSNRGITARGLKANLVSLAALAEKNADAWSKLGKQVAPQSKPAAKQQTASEIVAKSGPTVSGPAVSGLAVSGPAGTVPPKVTTTPAVTPATNPQKELSLVGRWGATLANSESFAILVEADGRFKLVHVKGDKSSVSSGKASRSEDRLTLVGDDKVTINGKVTHTTADKFRLAILNEKSGKIQATLDFTKAN